jgi:uncharacterized membrane protein YfcA
VSLVEALAILFAGVAAGTINVVVGSGTLITFPILLTCGFPPVVANVSNTIGLVPGSLSGVVGYRRELRDQRRLLPQLCAASLIGGIIGAIALLELPDDAFEAIVPVFIVAALVLIVLQPRLAKRLADRRPDREQKPGALTTAAVVGTGIYGGYFGAAQGILLLGILGVALPEDLQHVNAIKNLLAMLVNLVAGIVFVFVAPVDWGAAGLVAGGSIVGGALGARYGRRLPPTALRALIVVVGLVAIVRLLA